MGPGMGAATSAPGGQAILPSVHEIDLSIQADPRVMQMTVGAVPSTSSAHAQVCFFRIVLILFYGVVAVTDLVELPRLCGSGGSLRCGNH